MSRWAKTFAALSRRPDSLDTARHYDSLPSTVSHTVKSATGATMPLGPSMPRAEVRALATSGEIERAAIAEHNGGIPRFAVVRWINDHFPTSPIGKCAHCGQGARPGDGFVLLFSGEDHADVHASCWRAWQAAQEARALAALHRGPQ
jgi:hypothetical protein